MFLLTVVAVAFLSLAVVQTKATRVDFHVAEAQANARLALIIAIGELQRDLGPDQRVSATASILAKKEGDEMEHPHWTGAWKTLLPGDQPIWTRDDSQKGLTDNREATLWDRENEVLNFFVSGNEGGKRNRGVLPVEPNEAISSRDRVVLVGEGSVGDLESAEVMVPRARLTKEGRPAGSYAFWIGDLGVKANVATGNGSNEGLTSQDEIYPFLTAGRVSTEVMEGGNIAPLSLTMEDREKVLFPEDLDLIKQNEGKGWRKNLFHDFTTQSRGVLANVKEGGLKKNLTAFLNQRAERDQAPDDFSYVCHVAGLGASGRKFRPCRHRGPSAESRG